MNILCYLEYNDSRISKGTLTAIGAALELKRVHGYEKVVGLVCGGEDAAAVAELASGYGLDEVVFVSDAKLSPYLAITHTTCVQAVIDQLQPDAVLALSSTRGKDLLPRVAGYLGGGMASDVLEFVQGGQFKRPMYAGDIIATVEIITEKKVMSIRGTAFEPAAQVTEKSPVRELNVSIEAQELQQFVAFDTTKSERPELTEAEVVVSGGRALKSAENFETYIAPLADALDAAIGASRAAVDSGYAPNDWQVGQTGKVVAPNLYIAVGISGAIQHLAGMKDSKVIVAINKDAEAPIFEIADYGLVADLYDAVPKLTEEIKKTKSA